MLFLITFSTPVLVHEIGDTYSRILAEIKVWDPKPFWVSGGREESNQPSDLSFCLVPWGLHLPADFPFLQRDTQRN